MWVGVAFLEFGEVAFEAEAAGEDEIGVVDLFEILDGGFKEVRVFAGRDEVDDFDLVASDLAGPVREDGVERDNDWVCFGSAGVSVAAWAEGEE